MTGTSRKCLQIFVEDTDTWKGSCLYEAIVHLLEKRGVAGATVWNGVMFVVVEALCGWFAHSLALLSDAGHNLADAAALGFSWYALWISDKPSHEGMTFGYHRVGVFAALANAVSLVVMAVWIGWEAIARIRQPENANGGVMIGIATTAIIVNVLIGMRGKRKKAAVVANSLRLLTYRERRLSFS